MSKKSINTLGATNHSKKERSKLDYYGTDPNAVRALLNVEQFNSNVWEPTAGHHNIVKVLEEYGYNVMSTDIFDYGFGDKQLDFLNFANSQINFDGDIIMNPPYYDAGPFVQKALDLVRPGKKVVAFLRLLFLEGQGRYESIFKNNPPKIIYVFSRRQVCSKVDDFTEGSAVCYAWYVWEKGFTGDPVIKWI
jgi:hypothetical protein